VATAKKAKNVVLVAGTQQNLSNIYFLKDIYVIKAAFCKKVKNIFI